MILGTHVFPKTDDPAELAQLLADRGIRAGYCPHRLTTAETQRISGIRREFEKRDIVIAEVGVWNNPMLGTPEERKAAEAYIIDRLQVAEELGARCCVNVVGTKGPGDSCVPENYSESFFEECVDLARRVVDAVKPKHTMMGFEITPFTFLDGLDGYERLLKAIDRPEVGVHLDPANTIFTPSSYLNNRREIRKLIRGLSAYGICSVHLKDLFLVPALANIRIDEVMVGTGGLDLRSILWELDRCLPHDTPMMLEHLETQEEYDQAVANVRAIADELRIRI